MTHMAQPGVAPAPHGPDDSTTHFVDLLTLSPVLSAIAKQLPNALHLIQLMLANSAQPTNGCSELLDVHVLQVGGVSASGMCGLGGQAWAEHGGRLSALLMQ